MGAIGALIGVVLVGAITSIAVAVRDVERARPMCADYGCEGPVSCKRVTAHDGEAGAWLCTEAERSQGENAK